MAAKFTAYLETLATRKMIPMDITDNDSVTEAVSYILGESGSIDILVNNAGFGISSSIEDTSIEEITVVVKLILWPYLSLLWQLFTL